MTTSSLETQIAAWRSYAERRHAIGTDTAELEGHLRDRITDLTASGLSEDEAFLVAVKRMGSLDSLTREFAREHSDRLWKQLVLVDEGTTGSGRHDIAVMSAFAVAAAVLVKIPILLGAGLDTDRDISFWGRNAALLALAPLAGYLLWARGSRRRVWASVAALFALGAVAINAYPMQINGSTALLAGLHLPIALWLVVAIAYADGAWRDDRHRMDFIRFTGEWIIYMTLIALGGGVLAALVLGTFQTLGYDVGGFVLGTLLPCGAAGAVVVSAWLVEAKKGVVENMAPVLGQVFTPLFVLALGALVAGLVLADGLADDRDALILFDLLLVVVLGLLVYCVSAREPSDGPTWFDQLQLALVTITLAVDLVVLVALAARIGDFGFSANKTAALGENLILLANLAWSAVLLWRLVRGRAAASLLQRWQAGYLTVYAAWAWLVVLAFPVVFGFG
jgi:hypothetical protein